MCSDSGNRFFTIICRKLFVSMHVAVKSLAGCGTVPALLGRAHRPRWGLLGVAAAGFCLLTLPPASGAGHTPSLHHLRAEDANLAAKSRSAVLGLYSLDTRLTDAQTRLASLEAEAQTLRAERASIDQQIRLARLDARLSQDRLAARLRFIYEYGNTSSLDIVMGATSLENAMTALDDFDRVAAANANVLEQVRSVRSRLTHLSHELALHQQALRATTLAVGTTVRELDLEHTQRAAYIEQLATRRALDAAQIAQLDARARAADLLSQKLTPSPSVVAATPAIPAQAPAATPRFPAQAAAAAPLPAPVTGARTLTVIATGYDLSGTTSTGLPVGWGIAAVDPSVIPLGTHIVIPGYGEAVAADTGSAVVGSTIDLWFPTAAQAFAWGRRTVTIDID